MDLETTYNYYRAIFPKYVIRCSFFVTTTFVTPLDPNNLMSQEHVLSEMVSLDVMYFIFYWNFCKKAAGVLIFLWKMQHSIILYRLLKENKLEIEYDDLPSDYIVHYIHEHFYEKLLPSQSSDQSPIVISSMRLV